MLTNTCDRCAALRQVYEIRTPGELTQAMRVVRDNLADATLIPVSAESAEVLRPEGPWPDVIRREYQCSSCSQHFILTAETYHGSGGAWRQA
jgi:hypothetical protein